MLFKTREITKPASLEHIDGSSNGRCDYLLLVPRLLGREWTRRVDDEGTAVDGALPHPAALQQVGLHQL